MRALIVAIVVVSLLGIAPVRADGGACSSKPCCAKTKVAVTLQGTGCCSAIRCAQKQHDQKDVVRPSANEFGKTKPAAVLSARFVSPALIGIPAWRISSSPPPTGDRRLALLSTLLI